MKRRLLRLLGRAGLLGPAFRAYERALGWRGRRHHRSAADGLPVPPAELIVRVAGTADVDWFLEGGRLGYETVREHAPEELGSVLDFGCGCGRVTRYWLGTGVRVAGSDLNDDALEWCRRNLPFARFELNGLAPPLAFEDAEFELVYGLSVFTHLPEELQIGWLHELARVLRPGGRLLLTTHGDRYRGRLDPPERARYDAGEVVVRWQEVAGSNLCAAYHPLGSLARLANGRFEEIAFVTEGARGNPHQDVHVFRRV
jgi:SAM-dependent methyltransferase